MGCIHLLNTRKYCDNTCKYCGNTHKYWANTWKMWSPTSPIFKSIVTILVSFEAILKRFFVRINFKSQFQSNYLPQALGYIKITSWLRSNLTILVSFALAGERIGSILVSITTILTSIITILASIEQVNTPMIYWNNEMLKIAVKL